MAFSTALSLARADRSSTKMPAQEFLNGDRINYIAFEYSMESLSGASEYEDILSDPASMPRYARLLLLLFLPFTLAIRRQSGYAKPPVANVI
jgi:hypothetical protein